VATGNIITPVFADGGDDLCIGISQEYCEFHIAVQSRGFAGSGFEVFHPESLRHFSNALTAVAYTAKGEACLQCVRPSDIDVKIRPLNARGRYGIEGCAAKATRSNREGITHVVTFLFEIEPSQIEKAARQVADAIANA